MNGEETRHTQKTIALQVIDPAVLLPSLEITQLQNQAISNLIISSHLISSIHLLLSTIRLHTCEGGEPQAEPFQRRQDISSKIFPKRSLHQSIRSQQVSPKDPIRPSSSIGPTLP